MYQATIASTFSTRGFETLRVVFLRRSSTWTRRLATSDQITHFKSTFHAFATHIQARPPDQSNVATWMKANTVPLLLSHIHNVEPRTRRASHEMYAWRIRSGTAGMVYSGSSNGGEAGAGERLERLLELSSCEDVILVVFRWYGGVKLGSDRWRCISSVAKEALDRGGFLGGREDHNHAKDDYASKKRKKSK